MRSLILASASPRRSELLTQIGSRFAIQPANIDECVNRFELPQAYVRRMAVEKAAAVYDGSIDTVVLGADTIVVCNGDILGKPDDVLQAVNYLRRLSGRTHQVMTAVALCGSDISECLIQVSQVTFRNLSDNEISRYAASGEPSGKAGAYAIQGLAGAFVEHLDGSYSGVMGLPLAQTASLLQRYAVLPV